MDKKYRVYARYHNGISSYILHIQFLHSQNSFTLNVGCTRSTHGMITGYYLDDSAYYSECREHVFDYSPA